MAAADPLPAKSVPKNTTTCGNDTVQDRKHKQRPLDAALLCSMLEDHQRERQAATLRREKRNAVRNGSYVPRSAAQSFTATATPMPMMNVKNLSRAASSGRRSTMPHFIVEPLTTDGRICIPAKQRYAALNVGVRSGDDAGASDNEETTPVKTHRVKDAHDVRNTKKHEQRFSYRPGENVFREFKNPAAAPRKVSLPDPVISKPLNNERRSSIQTSHLERSKPSTTTEPVPILPQHVAPRPVQSAPSKVEPVVSRERVPAISRDVSPLRADEAELARGKDRWPSIDKDEKDAVQSRLQDGSDSEEHGISLMQALNMDFEQSVEAELSETTAAFKWDLEDPFKPQKGDSAKSEKHDASRLQSKHDSMNPIQCDPKHGNGSGTQPTPHRRRSSPRTSPQKQTSPGHGMEERGRQRYRPGDAAKRRGDAPIAWPVDQLRPASFHAITESRLSRFLEQEVSLDAPIPEIDEQLLAPRPKMVPHDRPDWSQESQNGDDGFFPTLNSLLPRRKATQVIRHSAILALFAEPKAPSPKKYRGPQNDHLIADAVKIIQQQEKSKWRGSVMGLFKNL